MAKTGFLNFFSLGKDINKAKGDDSETTSGLISDFLPELKIDSSDETLIKLQKRWLHEYQEYEDDKLKDKQKMNEKYWLGTQDDDNFLLEDDRTSRHRPQDNLIFEATETFLPQATAKNPEPIVMANETEEGKVLADDVRKVLIDIADKQSLKLKIKTATRHWALAYLGVIKVGWDLVNDDVKLTAVRPQRMILDPSGHVDESGSFTGEYIGYYKNESASSLVKRFPSKSDQITKAVNKEMGTKLSYIEWWADNGEIVFWTLKDLVLDKSRNPNWNYDIEEQTEVIDDLEEVSVEGVIGKNHFKTPQFPFAFLSVFNLGKQPHDETSLIEQNLPNQDIINNRYRQIDKNVADMNGGWIISGPGSGITKEQSTHAITSLRDGFGIWIPTDNTNSIQRVTGIPLSPDVFNQLNDARNELRGIFGVQGSTPQGLAGEQTVRGKIIVAQKDQSRIGGGVGEYIEQMADRIFNLMVQMIYVYYDEEHLVATIGDQNSVEVVSLTKGDMNIDLVVSVKAGSMIPKDPLTVANQAIDLFAAGAIDPVELHKRLDSPNPVKAAEDAIKFQLNPQSVLSPENQVAPPQPPGGAPAPGGGIPEPGADLLASVPLP